MPLTWMDPGFSAHIEATYGCQSIVGGCVGEAQVDRMAKESRNDLRMRFNGFDRRNEHWYLILDSWFLIDFQPICSRAQGQGFPEWVLTILNELGCIFFTRLIDFIDPSSAPDLRPRSIETNRDKTSNLPDILPGIVFQRCLGSI